MSPSDDHLSGINSLVPRWDPNNLDKGYSYNKDAYDRADYQKFKEARAARDKARNAKAQAELKATNKDVKSILRDQLRPNRPLEWDGESECFADLEYDAEAGGVYATFHRGGAGTYFYPMSRQEAAEWFDDKSAGGFFNDFVR